MAKILNYLVLAALLAASLAFGETGNAEQWESSLSIGPEGLSIGGVSTPNLGVRVDKGTVSADFSLTGNRPARSGNFRSDNSLPIRPSTSTRSSVLTDSDTFFKNVGK